jgi:hypothetical protein
MSNNKNNGKNQRIQRFIDNLYVSVLKRIRPFQYLIITAFLLNLTGCAGLVHSYGELADARDPCQMKHKAENHVRPDWCFSGQGYTKPTRVYSPTNQHIATFR